MISTAVDKLTALHPSFAEYCRRRIEYFFDTSDGRNIAVCFVSGIAAGIWAGYGPPLMTYIAAAAAVIVWIQASILAGFLRQWFFVVFSAAYFMLPYVFILPAGSEAEAEADIVQRTLSELMINVPLMPMELIAGSGDPFFISLALFIVFFVLFAVGAGLRNKAKRSDFYCRTRLEQLK